MAAGAALGAAAQASQLEVHDYSACNVGGACKYGHPLGFVCPARDCGCKMAAGGIKDAWAVRMGHFILLPALADKMQEGAQNLLLYYTASGRLSMPYFVLIAVSRILSRGFEGRGPLSLLGGSIYIVWAFRSEDTQKETLHHIKTLLGARIGRDVCLYPHGADPAMTEPDLVTIGNGACIDDAALVAHINARGNFELNQVKIPACLQKNSVRKPQLAWTHPLLVWHALGLPECTPWPRPPFTFC
eukprot:1141625-Pelagomonas_calceolata.AAC.3